MAQHLETCLVVGLGRLQCQALRDQILHQEDGLVVDERLLAHPDAAKGPHDLRHHYRFHFHFLLVMGLWDEEVRFPIQGNQHHLLVPPFQHLRQYADQ